MKTTDNKKKLTFKEAHKQYILSRQKECIFRFLLKLLEDYAPSDLRSKPRQQIFMDGVPVPEKVISLVIEQLNTFIQETDSIRETIEKSYVSKS